MTMQGNFVCPDSLSMDAPFVMDVAHQVRSYCGVGICDPVLQNFVQAPEPWRYDSGLWAFSAAATAVPTSGGAAQLANVDGDNLQLPTTGLELVLLQTGVAEPIGISNPAIATWFNKTTSETDLLRKGSPIPRNFMFMVTGAAVEFSEPFQRGGTGAAVDDPRVYSDWLRPQPNGPLYSASMQQFLISNVALRIAFNDQGSYKYLGRAAHYPQIGGPNGSVSIRNGNTGAGASYTPFFVAMMLGSFDDSNQARLSCTVGQSAIIQSNAAAPTISGTAIPGVINSANDGTVFVEQTVTLIGHPVIAPADQYCQPPK